MFDSVNILNILLGTAVAFLIFLLLFFLLAMMVYRWLKRRHKQRQQERADALERFVRRGGWYRQMDSAPLAAQLAALPVPANGTFRGLYQRPEGASRLYVFRLDREGEASSSSAEGHQVPGISETVLLVENDHWQLPPFYLLYTHHMPRIVVDWMPVALPGMTRVWWTDEDVPEFTSKFKLCVPSSRYESEVRLFFSTTRRRALVRGLEMHPPLGRMTMMVVQGQGNCLVVHGINYAVPPQRLTEFVDQTTAVAKFFTPS